MSVSARRISKGFACVCVFDTRSHDKPREVTPARDVGGWFSFSQKSNTTHHRIVWCLCEGSIVSVETRRARVRESCIRAKTAVGSKSRSRPGARRATRLRARSLGTGRDPCRSPPIPASGNGKPLAKRFLARFPRRDRRRGSGAAATGSVRAPLPGYERAGFRSDVPSVTTSRRVFEVASGSCRGRGSGFRTRYFGYWLR